MKQCPWFFASHGCDLEEDHGGFDTPHIEFRQDDNDQLLIPLQVNFAWAKGAPNEFKGE